VITSVAVFAHFTLETDKELETHSLYEEASKIGWLGVALFWIPIAISVLMNWYWVNKQRFPGFREVGFSDPSGNLNGILAATWLCLILSMVFGHIFYYIHIFVNCTSSFLIFVLYNMNVCTSRSATLFASLWPCCAKIPEDPPTHPEIALNLLS